MQKTDVELIKVKDYDSLIKKYEPMIHYMMKKIIFDQNEYDDLFNIGRLGIYNAALNFDWSKGFKFSTYVGKAIYLNILDYIRKKTNNKNKMQDADIEFIKTIKDNNKHNNPEYYIHMEELNSIFSNIKSIVTETEYLYIYLSFYENKTQTEIANMFGITQVAVSRVMRKGLSKVKEILIKKGITPDYIESGEF